MKIQKVDELAGWVTPGRKKAEKKPQNSRFFHMLRKGFETGKFVRI